MFSFSFYTTYIAVISPSVYIRHTFLRKDKINLTEFQKLEFCHDALRSHTKPISQLIKIKKKTTFRHKLHMRYLK